MMLRVAQTAAFMVLLLLPATTSALAHRNELQLTEEERILMDLEQWADMEMERYQKVRGILPIRAQTHDDEGRIKGLRGK